MDSQSSESIVVESVVVGLERLLLSKMGVSLNPIQRLILMQVWQGCKYRDIAQDAGYTEGHIKDVGSDLWRLLSKVLGAKITKSNCKAVVKRSLQAAGLYRPDPVSVPTHASPPAVEPSPIAVATASTVTSTVTSTVASTLPIALPISPSSDRRLLGRTAAIAHLDHLLQQGENLIILQGEGGLGKTTLAQHYLDQQGFDRVLELLMAKETQNITPAERVVEEWLRQDFGIEPGLEFGVALGRLKRQLETQRVGILIDNLEPALDAQGCFIESQRCYLELLRVLSDARVRSVTLVTSHDRLCEADLSPVHYRLPGLDPATWLDFFIHQGITVDEATLQQMCHAYGGNAKAMGILCGAIQSDYAGEMLAYWQDHQHDLLATLDLKHLIDRQIQRLNQLDPQATQLLFRLSCYRYQDVPRISHAAVQAMLWDVPDVHHRTVIASLHNRSLLESQRGEYWLHPIVREAAIAQLRTSPDWQNSHAKAAAFWTEQVTTIHSTQDAVRALEAYYHSVAMGDFSGAASVILKSRNNQWKQFLPLGSTLYRMGLIQPVRIAIETVLENAAINQSHDLGELYNILGDLYWIAGRVHDAIACQEKTIQFAQSNLQRLQQCDRHHRYYLQMLNVDSMLSLGLYSIDLWELPQATHWFEQVIAIAAGTDHALWAEKATVCLALVWSYLSQPQQALLLADQMKVVIQQSTRPAGQFAYFIQILGQVYLNLGHWEQADHLHQQALQSATTSHYPQIQARTLTGLAQLHRQQQRYAPAIALHGQAIDLLEAIGAKCDLAEAYFRRC
ncbi:MAG: tetratricopeptide repeat protein [Synechococcales bacterium]|nr:tetratricopeptide repeat protein [Synechococcales bacterium]